MSIPSIPYRLQRHNPDSQQWKPRHCRTRLEAPRTTTHLVAYSLLLLYSVEAACYATLPGYGGRGTGRISALAGLVWWSRPDRQRCYTEALGCMAWLAGKRDWTAKQPGHMYRYLSIYWYTTSIVAFHVECRGLQLRSTRRACQQVQVHAPAPAPARAEVHHGPYWTSRYAVM